VTGFLCIFDQFMSVRYTETHEAKTEFCLGSTYVTWNLCSTTSPNLLLVVL